MQGDGTGEALTALGVADEAAADQVALVAQLRDKIDKDLKLDYIVTGG